MISLAAFSISFFVGILFGMPKRKDNDSDNYTLNNSLVEISEWLTKIIVGLSLVNLQNIPPYLVKIGNYIEITTQLKNITSLKIISISLIIYYSFLGLYFGYNYMRIFLSLKYRDVDNEMVKEIDKLKQEIDAKKEAVEKLETKTNLVEAALKSSVKSENEINEIKNLNTEISQKIELLKLKAFEKTDKVNNIYPDDTQKGKWGGLSQNNNKIINAEINELYEGLYQIKINVQSVDSQSPLEDGNIVIFALHPTFHPKVRLVKVKNGVATLELIAFGSFTVGAYADYDGTELEIDLAEVPGVSQYFKTH
ncbi:hypothetical protein GCM10027164_17290 [Algoriphagus taiwanensis]